MPDPRDNSAPGGARPAAPAGPTPHALDEAIVRFWSDFVQRQTATGRRDVARMLEVALEFFFERSTQLGEQDARRRQHLEQFIEVVRAERARVDDAIAEHVAARGEAEAALQTPFAGKEVLLHERDDGQPPVVTRPLQAPFAQLGQLRQYAGVLERQGSSAEGLVQQMIDRMVSTRSIVAGRLKELSPQLYQQGIAAVAQLDGSQGGTPPPPAPSSAAAPPVADAAPAAEPRLGTGVQAAAVAAAAAAAAAANSVPRRLRAQLALLLARLRHAWAGLLDLRHGAARRARAEQARERSFEESLQAYQRKAKEWE